MFTKPKTVPGDRFFPVLQVQDDIIVIATCIRALATRFFARIHHFRIGNAI